mmetsp:Transcript_5758/g.9542  ORF Transcript_5758/g.9542 Transcript_5758/m.9542 type:complete len:102 (+) Transcript_5758:1496-1801(+)
MLPLAKMDKSRWSKAIYNVTSCNTNHELLLKVSKPSITWAIFTIQFVCFLVASVERSRSTGQGNAAFFVRNLKTTGASPLVGVWSEPMHNLIFIGETETLR